jgi:hypothetical protein
MTTNEQLIKALKVIVLTPHIREYLLANDLKAFEQARKAIAAAEYVPAGSRPHAFEPGGVDGDCEGCAVCGKLKAWPVHQEVK